MTRRITRRQAIGEVLAGTALIAAGCGTATAPRPDPHGSTLNTTYQDAGGTGVLTPAAGEPLQPRTELGARAAAIGVLASIAHVTDPHILDAQSPARVTFLDRLGPPFQSTFRPQEALTAQVLAGALYAIRALSPDAVIQGGDLIDNDQANELELALEVLRGGRASPEAGRAATSVSNPRSTPIPSTTVPTSTPRVIRDCSRRRRVAFTVPASSRPGIRCSATTTCSWPARSPPLR